MLLSNPCKGGIFFEMDIPCKAVLRRCTPAAPASAFCCQNGSARRLVVYLALCGLLGRSAADCGPKPRHRLCGSAGLQFIGSAFRLVFFLPLGGLLPCRPGASGRRRGAVGAAAEPAATGHAHRLRTGKRRHAAGILRLRPHPLPVDGQLCGIFHSLAPGWADGESLPGRLLSALPGKAAATAALRR